MANHSVYKELTHDREIRILELLPGTSPQPLSCKLKHITLGQNHEYEALSYEWGSSENSGNVRCNSVDMNARLNLIGALKVLRHEKNARRLWVDALCINQGNFEERSKQVILMREIYAMAQTVLVWLGNEISISKSGREIIESLALVCIQRMGKSSSQENYLPFIFKKGEPLFTSKDDMLWFSPAVISRAAQQENQAMSYSLPARDDAIFSFDNTLLWKEVLDAFGSSYFGRSWIIQEVSVADNVNIICDACPIPWEIFKFAYRGWELIRPIRNEMHEGGINKAAPFSGVRDARERFRKPPEEYSSDLAGVLATFNYTKQTDPRDHIYAALGLVTVPLQRTLPIVPDYKKLEDEVFIEAAEQIINERQDLYLWGLNTLLSARSPEMGLPTWVPEWTSTNDEQWAPVYNRHFSGLVPGYFEFRARGLLVNGILDTIAVVFPKLSSEISHLSNLFPLLTHLKKHLSEIGGGLLKQYPKDFSNSASSDETSGGLVWEDNYLRRLRALIGILVELIRDIAKLVFVLQCIVLPLNCDKVISNLESLWLVLTQAPSYMALKPPPPGEKLFLACLYLGSTYMATMQPRIEIDKFLSTIPMELMVWTIAALRLHAPGNKLRQLSSMIAFYEQHLRCLHMDRDSFFMTKRGHFGRAPSSDVKAHHTVAILGGAWTPHILERHDSYYKLVSHAYVQGLGALKPPLSNILVERIELR